MARTLYGNLTGRAASTERHEQMNRLMEDFFHADLEREAANRFRLADAMDTLRACDPNWEAWYNSDALPDWHNNLNGWLNIEPILDVIYSHCSEAFLGVPA
jgi:hypothetical protein